MLKSHSFFSQILFFQSLSKNNPTYSFILFFSFKKFLHIFWTKFSHFFPDHKIFLPSKIKNFFSLFILAPKKHRDFFFFFDPLSNYIVVHRTRSRISRQRIRISLASISRRLRENRREEQHVRRPVSPVKEVALIPTSCLIISRLEWNILIIVIEIFNAVGFTFLRFWSFQTGVWKLYNDRFFCNFVSKTNAQKVITCMYRCTAETLNSGIFNGMITLIEYFNGIYFDGIME